MRGAVFSLALLTLAGGVGFPTLLNASQKILYPNQPIALISENPHFAQTKPYWKCNRPKRIAMEHDTYLLRDVYGRLL